MRQSEEVEVVESVGSKPGVDGGGWGNRDSEGRGDGERSI